LASGLIEADAEQAKGRWVSMAGKALNLFGKRLLFLAIGERELSETDGDVLPRRLVDRLDDTILVLYSQNVLPGGEVSKFE
jgi:hypothetical protein